MGNSNSEQQKNEYKMVSTIEPVVEQEMQKIPCELEDVKIKIIKIRKMGDITCVMYNNIKCFKFITFQKYYFLVDFTYDDKTYTSLCKIHFDGLELIDEININGETFAFAKKYCIKHDIDYDFFLMSFDDFSNIMNNVLSRVFFSSVL